MKNSAKTKQLTSAIVTDGIGTDILQGSVVGTAAMTAGLIGAWSVSCLVSGIIAAGGPLGLVTSWVTAISGM